MGTSLKERFDFCRCAPGNDESAIEARYRRLSGKVDSPKSGDFRLPSERDRDRIVYSASFRRLGEITQVIPRERACILHNRLTHSLKVAQLGRRMAERLLMGPEAEPNKKAVELANQLGGLDPNVVETAALSHDLGHPPFGHVIEEFLDHEIRRETADGYEGNAQTFRIISFLENRDVSADHRFGLDLTLASLNATLKYPWERDLDEGAVGIRVNKFGYYAHSYPDKDHFRKVRDTLSKMCGGDGLRSLEAELMDWADDIAYAIYDIDDFYRAGLIPLDKILRENFDPAVKAHEVPDSETLFFFAETRQRWKAQRRDKAEQDKLPEYFTIFGEFLRKVLFSQKALKTQAGTSSFKSSTFSLWSAYRATDEQRRALATLTSALVEEFTSSISLNPESINDRSKPKVVIAPEAKAVVKLLKEMTWTYVIDSPDLHVVQEGQKQIVSKVFEILEHAPGHDLKLIPRSIRDLFKTELVEGASRRRQVCDIIASMTETQIADLYARLTGISPGSLLRSTYVA